MTDVIKQIVRPGEYGTQTIKMIVHPNERGPKGDKGDQGDTATIEAGQAYSVPAGRQPSVINVGSETNARFDFYIPKGDTGAQGPQGEPGANGRDGKNGVIQYTAGPGIKIKNNVISVVGGGGGGGGVWGDIIGDIEDQTDLQAEFAEYTKTSGLATVATTGSYSDLTNTPAIPAAQVQSDWDQSDSGSVDYIKNKPTIPTVNNATLTIQQNGTNVATFTANSSTDATASITTPVITMTTTDPGEGSALAANNYVGVYGGTPVITDYSTLEVNTGAIWIDGKAIYKKTISSGALPNNSTKNVAHSISGIDTVVKIDAIMKNGDGSQFWAIPYTTLDVISTDSTYVNLHTTADLSAYTAYITLYYTKSS